MALIASQPLSQALALSQFSARSIVYTPKTPAGAAIDLTGYNEATMNVYADATGLSTGTEVSLTASGGDATSLTVTISSANVDDVIGRLGTTRGQYTILVGNGTNTLNLVAGAIQVTPTGVFAGAT